MVFIFSLVLRKIVFLLKQSILLDNPGMMCPAMASKAGNLTTSAVGLRAIVVVDVVPAPLGVLPIEEAGEGELVGDDVFEEFALGAGFVVTLGMAGNLDDAMCFFVGHGGVV